MWIQYTKTTSTGRPAVSALTVDGQRIDFSDNGKANVTAGLGERLIAQSDHIVAAGEADADDDSPESDATEGTDDEPASGDGAAGRDADADGDTESAPAADADDNGDS